MHNKPQTHWVNYAADLLCVYIRHLSDDIIIDIDASIIGRTLHHTSYLVVVGVNYDNILLSEYTTVYDRYNLIILQYINLHLKYDSICNTIRCRIIRWVFVECTCLL